MNEPRMEVSPDHGVRDPSPVQYRLFAVLLGIVVVAVYAAFYVAQTDWPPRIDVGQAPTASTRLKNRIALLDASQRIWVVNPTSNERRMLFDDTLRCEFPTWSRDGSLIASIATDEMGATRIYGTASEGGESIQLLGGDDISPEYFNWSPDGTLLLYRGAYKGIKWAQVVSLMEQRELYSVKYINSVYWNWSEDGEHILWNSDGTVSRMENNDFQHDYPQRQRPSEFRAPAWSSNGGGFVYTDNHSLQIYNIDYSADASESGLLFGGPDYSNIVAAPDYSCFALINFHRGRYGVGYIVERDDKLTSLPLRVRATFWSPDGRFLAFWCNEAGETRADREAPPVHFSLIPESHRSEDTECWWIYDLERKTPYPLVEFIPTEHSETMAESFSQYHTSHRLWSPDSRYFLVPSVDPGSKLGQVWIVDVAGEAPPVNIGEGVFASWSWE